MKIWGLCSSMRPLQNIRNLCKTLVKNPSPSWCRYLTLRPYQQECIDSVLDHLEQGHRRLGISLATGAGKTIIFSQLIGKIKSKSDRATKSLVLVHRRELVLQAYKHCRDAYPNLNVEVDMGSMHATGSADITVASVMSLQRGRLSNYDPSNFKLILIDEAHHAVSQSYLKVLKHFGLVDTVSSSDASVEPSEGIAPTEAPELREGEMLRQDPVLVGVSATFSRFDGLSLGHVIDQLVYHKDYIDLIDESWLSEVCFTTAKLNADLSNVKTHFEGDFVSSSLSAAMNTQDTNDAVIRTWVEKAHDRKTTLVFAVDVAHVEGLEVAFRDHGIDARSVTAKTPLHIRSATVEAFRHGEFPVLLNCGIFTEGTDIPNIDCVLLARPTKSRNLLVQMIGRGMRRHENKRDCHVIDMVSTLKVGIVSVPTLFGLNPSTLLEKSNVSELRLRREPLEIGNSPVLEEDSMPKVGSIQFKEYDSILDLLMDGKRDLHLRQISKNAWVQVGPDKEGNERYILAGNDSSYLRITERQHSKPPFEVAFLSRIPVWARGPKSRGLYRAAEKVALAQDLKAALRAADTYTKDGQHAKYFPRYIVDAQQAWRQRPATASQLEMLDRIGGDAYTEVADSITGGQAATMLTRIKHGAKTHFRTMKSKEARIDRRNKAKEREGRMREREQVKVGPIH